MKTILCTLLAITLCATAGFADNKAQPAAYVTASSLVEIGKTYTFVAGNYLVFAKVTKKFNEYWIQIQEPKANGGRTFSLNLQAIISILPETEPPKP